MKKTEAQELATKIVDKLGSYEHIEVDDMEKDYKLETPADLKDFTPDKSKHHVFRFTELGYGIVGADKDKKVAKAQVVDVLAADLISGDLVLADGWAENNL